MSNKKETFDYVAYNTIQEAEKAANFKVLLPKVLKVDAIEKIGLIAGQVVEVCYSNNVVYRMAKEEKDISGDYKQYECTKQESIGAYEVIEKGTQNLCFSAHWSGEGYSFSIELPHGIIYASVQALIQSLSEVEELSCVNPMVEYPYLFEAEYAVGFGIPVPMVLNTNSIEKIYVIAKEIVEIVYHNNIIYRMGRGVLDISGDYTQYASQVNFTLGRYQVVAKGNLDLYYLVTWNDGHMSWSLTVPHGIHQKGVEELILSLCQADGASGHVTAGNSATAQVSLSDGLGASEQIMCGGFSEFRTLNDEERKEFSDFFHIIGVDYKPLLVSKNASIGCFRYLCNATTVTLKQEKFLALVELNAPWTGKQPYFIQRLVSE